VKIFWGRAWKARRTQIPVLPPWNSVDEFLCDSPRKHGIPATLELLKEIAVVSFLLEESQMIGSAGYF
jgi:hypothetical protein